MTHKSEEYREALLNLGKSSFMAGQAIRPGDPEYQYRINSFMMLDLCQFFRDIDREDLVKAISEAQRLIPKAW